MQTLDIKTARNIVSELVFVMKNGKLTPKFISNIITKGAVRQTLTSLKRSNKRIFYTTQISRHSTRAAARFRL